MDRTRLTGRDSVLRLDGQIGWASGAIYLLPFLARPNKVPYGFTRFEHPTQRAPWRRVSWCHQVHSWLTSGPV